jgi:hypothetical protein
MERLKNNFDEEFPESLVTVIKKCEDNLKIIENILKDKDCKTLGEFYHHADNKTKTLLNAFESSGYLSNVVTKNSKSKEYNELKGLYIFGEVVGNKTIPVYVGISQSIYRRLRQHGWGKTHNQATLAYAMAAKKISHSGKRNNELDLSIEQETIQNFKIAIIPEPLDFDLYFMEVYIAGVLKTKWNSFRTH